MIVGVMMKLGMISLETSRIFVLPLVCMCGIERTICLFVVFLDLCFGIWTMLDCNVNNLLFAFINGKCLFCFLLSILLSDGS